MTGIIIFEETEFTVSTTGYCEYSSMITSSCSTVGSGPQKSMDSFARVRLVVWTCSVVPLVMVQHMLIGRLNNFSQHFGLSHSVLETKA